MDEILKKYNGYHTFEMESRKNAPAILQYSGTLQKKVLGTVQQDGDV